MWLNWTKHRHRGLRTWILFVLEAAPKNGVEIMDAMQTMSQGIWKPSPGSVYPMLASMSEEGLIKEVEDRRYQITPQGKEEIEWVARMRSSKLMGREPSSLGDIIGEISNNVSYLEDLSKTRKGSLKEQSKKISDLASRLQALGEN
ncbi:MAG: PadR family transcriptional regulator [Nitrososphaerota archaeon]|nr:PadR family transcriptional regulator [Nitrososphaerota archaeon]